MTKSRWEDDNVLENRTRMRRLLLIAQNDEPPYKNMRRRFHKRYYYQYFYLAALGLIHWEMGTAFITKRGEQWLKDHSPVCEECDDSWIYNNGEVGSPMKYLCEKCSEIHPKDTD